MIQYPVRAAANGPSRYGIVDKRGFPLSTLGHHQERIAEAIAEAVNAAHNARLRELAALAVPLLREHSAYEKVFYDDAECDGTCLADDIESAL